MLSEELITEENIVLSYTIKTPSTSIDGFDEELVSLNDYRWMLVFNENGVPTEPPVVEIVDGKPVWDKKVYGVLRIDFVKNVSYYQLLITPLTDTSEAEASYQCTVMAIWGGGVEVLEITPPSEDGTCKGGSFYFGPGDDGDPSTQPDEDGDQCYKRLIRVHACTGEKLSDEVVQVACEE